ALRGFVVFGEPRSAARESREPPFERTIRPVPRGRSTTMSSSSAASAIGAAIALVTGFAHAQAPAPQPQGAGAQPAYSVASPPITSPLSAPAGKDSGAIRGGLPNGVNQGAFDPAKWKYGPAFSPPAGAKVWNPVKAKMLAGQKVSGGTLFNATD